MYPSNNFWIRQECSSLGKLGQLCVGGGTQVLKEVLETLEMCEDLRRDTQRPPQSHQHVPLVSRIQQQGQVLDRVIVQHLNSVTWTETEGSAGTSAMSPKLIHTGMNLLGGSQGAMLPLYVQYAYELTLSHLPYCLQLLLHLIMTHKN